MSKLSEIVNMSKLLKMALNVLFQPVAGHMFPSMACHMFQNQKCDSVSQWQCHLLSCQTLVWTAKKMYVMELICCKLRRVDRNYLQKTWDVHLGVIIITNPLVLQIYDDDADHFSDWDIDDDEFTHHNSDDDGNDDVNHRTVALNLLMLSFWWQTTWPEVVGSGRACRLPCISQLPPPL